MLAWVVIALTSPRETSRSAPGSAHPAINPLESHPCAISQGNSHRITFLRKNTPGGGVTPIFQPARHSPYNLQTFPAHANFSTPLTMSKSLPSLVIVSPHKGGNPKRVNPSTA